MPLNNPKHFLTALLFFFAVSLRAQVASFTVDNAGGCVPLVVHFTNTSTGATSYSWNFGNSTSSLLANPSVSYGAPGNYTVTLTAYNGAATSTSSLVISVYPLPVVSFFASDTNVCPGAPVTYSNSSVPGTAGVPIYTWNFGDGSTSTNSSPTYAHASPGFYNISLFVTNGMGCSKSLTKSTYMEIYTPPVPVFTASGTFYCNTPATVLFSNSSTGTAPLVNSWKFGDGSAETAATSPSHTYTASGTYDIRLKVTDGKGCIDSLTRAGYVELSSLNAQFGALSGVCEGEPVSFTNFSTPHLTSEWDFGDGATSFDEDPIHTYASAGTYAARLIVYDGVCRDTLIRNVVIRPNPTGTFVVSPAVPCPASTTLTYVATTSPGATVFWEFLDDSTGTGPTVTHNYLSGIMDTVVMTLVNGFGCTTVVKKADTVYDLLVYPVASKDNGCVPYSTTFACYVFAYAYNRDIHNNVFVPVPYTVTSYVWNFGDGSGPGTGISPSHTYTAVGVYSVTCTIATSTGCVRTGAIPVMGGVPPSITFTAVPTHICADRTVNFTSTTTGVGTSFLWKYGDGAIDSGTVFANTIHKYTVPGIDTVRVKAFHNGCPSNEAKTWILIDSPNAVPKFNFLCIPNNGIAFGDSSLGVNSRLWIFDDGTTSALKNPVHYYPSLSNYNVKLTTYNIASGCRDTAVIEVNLTPPFLLTSVSDPTICVNDSVTLYGFIFGYGAYRYRWFDNNVLIADTTSYRFGKRMNTPGYHDIMLELLDSRGCLDTLVKNDYILVGAPRDSFSVVTSEGCNPFTATFNNLSAAIPECRLKYYTWDFADGTIPTVSGVPGAVHTFTANGTYSVTLSVRDSIGCVSGPTEPVIIRVYKPHAAFVATTTNACIGSNIHFNNTSTEASTAFWTFGDGTTSTVLNPDHAYAASGLYTVRLIVTDSHGCSDTVSRTNYINIGPSPAAAFLMSDTFAVCPPLNVNFTNTTTGAVSYLWDFGNSTGSVITNPSSPYISSGLYTVKLVATNIAGCKDTAIGQVKVFGYTGAFSYTPVTGCMPQSVHFSASLGAFASLVWDFGDGVTSSSTLSGTATHNYPLYGAYVPKLILTDTTGCTNFSVGSDTIKVDRIIPSFRVTPDPVCQASSTVFADSSTAAFSPAAAWSWAFGDGATGTGSVIAHAYSMAGTYSASLSVTNGYGCTANVVRTVTVNPLPDTISGNRTVCIGFTTALTNATPGGVWSGSAPGIATLSPTGIVTSVGAGTVVVTYTLPTGCLVSAVVTVYALPGTVTGAGSVCENATLTWTCASPGGVWSSSDPSVATVGSGSGIITGHNAGSTFITYSLASGCITVRPLTVMLSPLPITGASSVCVNSTTTFFEALTGGVWSSSSPAVAIVGSSGDVTGISSGTADISYVFPGSGCSASKVISVLPLPDTITGPATVCAGQYITLNSATSGGSWTSSNSTIAFINPVTGVVHGLVAGVVDITYTLLSGCHIERSLTVTAVPAPITGTLLLCKFTSTTLVESVSGGVWSSGSPVVAIVDTVGLVTGINPGTAVISYSLGTGCSVYTVVTVLPIPDAITGNPSICKGFTSVLADTTPGGTWSSTDLLVATISPAGVVSALSVGTSTVSYKLSTGCGVRIIVTVNPMPDPISGSTLACVGVATYLSSLPAGGTWQSSDTSVAVIDLYAGIYTGVAAGTSFITYTTAAGCIGTTIISIQPIPPPIGGGPTVCAGFAVNLTNAMPGGFWTVGAGSPMVGSIHALTGVVTGITPGTITVSYTISTGCFRDLVVTVLPLPAVIAGAPSVCVGDSSVLSDATPGGTWSVSNAAIASIGSASGVLTGIAAGNAVVTYHAGNGCFNVLHVTVNPLPGPVTGPLQVCEGATITLASTPTPGGIWASDTTAAGTVGYLSGVVTGIATGHTNISYILSATGCLTRAQVTVNVAPPGITGNPHVCFGSSNTFSNTMVGGSWFSSNPAVATIDPVSGVASSVSLGVVTISYVLPVTGCMATKTVSVDPLPDVYNVTDGGNYCAGGTGVTIGLSGSQPGVSYELYRGTSVTGYLPGTGFGLNFGLHTAAGVYTVLATDVTSGCQRNMSGSANVVINSLITPSVSIAISPYDSVCPGQSVTLSAVPVNGGTAPTYLWKVNGVSVSTAGSYAFVPAHGDNVTMTMTSNANCLATTTATGVRNLTVLPTATPVAGVLTTPNDTICQFNPVTFTAAPSYGGATPAYQWLVNGVVVGTGNTYSYIPVDGDVVNLRMASDYRCRTVNTVTSGDVALSVDSIIIPRVTVWAEPGMTVAAGKPVTLHASATDAGPIPKFQWKVNGYPVPGATSDSYTAIFNDYDSISCVVTSSGVCANIGTHDWVFITTSVLGAQTTGTMPSDIWLLPNPTKGILTVRGTLWAGNDDVNIDVTDMLGQVVYRGTVTTKQGHLEAQIKLDGALANGTYILTLRTETEQRVFHLLLQH
jgi:PKD repeat protein